MNGIVYSVDVIINYDSQWQLCFFSSCIFCCLDLTRLNKWFTRSEYENAGAGQNMGCGVLFMRHL